MDVHDAAVHMDHDVGDLDHMDDMDVDVTGAELTTAMQGHQHLKQAEKRQKLLEKRKAGDPIPQGGVSNQSEPGAAGGDGADGKNEEDEEKQEPSCYEWFFGSAINAQDGSHSTGNALLDYYYEGDPDLKQEPIEIKHNSIERKLIYYAFAWLWCGCWEPKYKITNKYAIGEQWVCCPKDKSCTCCIKVTDSMAYETVDDLQKRQKCWYHILSCCGCCCRDTCACNDMADIMLIGGDDSHPEGWKLIRIRNATKLYNEVTKIVQDTQKDLSK